MNIFLWILQVYVGLSAIIVGYSVLKDPHQRVMIMSGPNAGKVVGLGGLSSPPWSVMMIVAGVALILPGAFGVVQIATPIAAAYLALYAVGEALADKSRGHMAFPGGRLIFLVLETFIAIGRFGPWPL